jgi:hypothetical protein
MNSNICTAAALQGRYPYMFSGDDSRLDFCRGWMPALAQACSEIDAVLGPDKRGFHWTQIKEKLGWARFYCRVDRQWRIVTGTEGESGPPRFEEISIEKDPILTAVHEIRHSAMAATQTVCMVCAANAATKYFGFYHLCDVHRPDRYESLRELWAAVWEDCTC